MVYAYGVLAFLWVVTLWSEWDFFSVIGKTLLLANILWNGYWFVFYLLEALK
jgi:hypothetical protein